MTSYQKYTPARKSKSVKADLINRGFAPVIGKNGVEYMNKRVNENQTISVVIDKDHIETRVYDHTTKSFDFLKSTNRGFSFKKFDKFVASYVENHGISNEAHIGKTPERSQEVVTEYNSIPEVPRSLFDVAYDKEETTIEDAIRYDDEEKRKETKTLYDEQYKLVKKQLKQINTKRRLQMVSSIIDIFMIIILGVNLLAASYTQDYSFVMALSMYFICIKLIERG